MITFINGDIFTTQQPAIGHGVNCEGAMGSGIAATIRELFPDVYQIYRSFCLVEGLYGGDLLAVPSLAGPVILNLASQEKQGRNAKYEWLEQSVKRSFEYCQSTDLAGFALPRIGSGIGGLNEAKAEDVIKSVAAKYPETELEIWTFVR